MPILRTSEERFEGLRLRGGHFVQEDSRAEIAALLDRPSAAQPFAAGPTR